MIWLLIWILIALGVVVAVTAAQAFTSKFFSKGPTWAEYGEMEHMRAAARREAKGKKRWQ